MLTAYLYLMNALKEQEGQTLVEYGLLLALIAIVVIAALLLLGPQVSAIFSRVTSALS